MAEIAALVTTCVSLVFEITKTIRTIHTLVKSFQSAPDDLENLASWLETTRTTIEILQAALDTPGKVDDDVKQDFNRSLGNCLKTVTKLHRGLEDVATSFAEDQDQGSCLLARDAPARLKYLWNESSITVDRTELHQHMQAVDVLLHVVQL